MKPKLQTSLGQHLVLTPQLRQAIHLLQLSTLELEAEIAEAVESNPLLDWSEPDSVAVRDDSAPARDEPPAEASPGDDGPAWEGESDHWQTRGGGDGDESDGDPTERIAESETLQDHLLWQLHLTHLSARDRQIGAALIDAIDAAVAGHDGWRGVQEEGFRRTFLADGGAARAADGWR